MFDFTNYSDGKMSVVIEPWGHIVELESEDEIQIDAEDIETIHYGSPDKFTPGPDRIVSIWIDGDAEVWKDGVVVFAS